MRLDPLQVKAAVGDHRAMVIHRAVMARRHVVVVDLSALTPTAGAVAAATEKQTSDQRIMCLLLLLQHVHTVSTSVTVQFQSNWLVVHLPVSSSQLSIICIYFCTLLFKRTLSVFCTMYN